MAEKDDVDIEAELAAAGKEFDKVSCPSLDFTVKMSVTDLVRQDTEIEREYPYRAIIFVPLYEYSCNP